MRETIVNITEVLPATIANGSALSGVLNLGGLRLFDIVVPSPWTTANLTFQYSPDNGATWANMYDIAGNELTALAAAGRGIALDPTLFAGIQFMQIRSGTSGTPVNQTQNSTLQLILRAV